MTCKSHGWRNLSPFEWESSSSKLHFACFAINQPVDIEVRQDGNNLSTKITSRIKLKKNHLEHLESQLARSLGVNIDTENLLKVASRIGKEYSGLVKMGAGRLLRSPSLWEDASKTLFTTNCTWSLTKKMSESLCSKKYSIPTPSNRFPFPKPGSISKRSISSLKKYVPIGYRADYFIELSKTFESDPSLKGIENKKSDPSFVHEVVKGFKGFGPYATAHLMVLSGHYEEVPIDTVVIAYLKKNYKHRNPKSFISSHFKNWGDYKWWGLKLDQMIKKQNWLGD